jgi:hypothetical protein
MSGFRQRDAAIGNPLEKFLAETVGVRCRSAIEMANVLVSKCSILTRRRSAEAPHCSPAAADEAPATERPVPSRPKQLECVMPALFFTCPKTQKRASTGVETDVDSLRASWSDVLEVRCPFCGEVHKMSVRETFIDSALHDATDRSRQAI